MTENKEKLAYRLEEEEATEVDGYTEWTFTAVVDIEDEEGWIDEERVIGWATVYEAHDDEEAYKVEISQLDVEDEYQGQGVGTAIIKRVVQYLGAAHIASCNEDNERLYARLGEKVGEGIQGGIYLVK